MTKQYKIAVVGSGPAGLSAAAHAAELGISHVLLEASEQISNTIFRYQKGKFVMAEPAVLPLRAPLEFMATQRETVLDLWNKSIKQHKVNVRYQAEVTGIVARPGGFDLSLKNGEMVQAENVVLGIGLQGNLRKLGVPGEDLPGVQYQLDDPKEYEGETIIVVGAGDAGIENAVALAEQNTVIIINRKDEFDRVKEGNLNLILQYIKDGKIECYYGTQVARMEESPGGDKPMVAVLNTATGEAHVPCDRLIARLGAIPPRKFVESCGIAFPNTDPAAVPAVTSTYESNVKGLYIVGALAGYPLIKQALNQGYEVVEFILGNDLEPADEPLLREKFQNLPHQSSVADALALIQDHCPLLAGITTLQLREFMLDSNVRTPLDGETIFALDDYTDTFYTILEGEVRVQVSRDDPKQQITLQRGQFFGEMSLISGRRRSATVLAGPGCVLIETPRRSMTKLIKSAAPVKRVIDEVFLLRAVQSQLAPNTPIEYLTELVKTARVERFAAGAVLFQEGDDADCLQLVRSGSLTASRTLGGREVVLSYIPAGNYVGEMALLGESKRNATIRAAVATETIRLDGEAFKLLLARDATLRQQVEAKYQQRLTQNVRMEDSPETGNVISFLVQQGLGEASDVLLIDEALCVSCNNCETACAETHDGTSRLKREAGPTYATVHVPTSCRHCEHPHCMKDCPPDAIHRAGNGEVYIADNCIGCGNCERNCPYGVIQMASAPDSKPGLLSWLLFGSGPGPGQAKTNKGKPGEAQQKHAVKCDMCRNLSGGPACVRACPTGAAIRVSPEDFMSFTNLTG